MNLPLQLQELLDFHSPALAKTFGSLTLLFAGLASILPNIELGVRLAAAIAALITAYFTVRYYRLAAREKELSILEKELSIKKLKSNTDEQSS